MCEAQRACKRGKLGCLWCTNLYVKTAVQLWGKKEREAPQKKRPPCTWGKRLAYSAASPRSGANCGVAASQSQKSAMIKTTAQRASGVKILRAQSRKKTVGQRSGKNLVRSTASCGKIFNLVRTQKINLCSHSRNMYLTPWGCSELYPPPLI